VSRLWEKKENFLQKLQLPVRIPGAQGYSRSEKHLKPIPVRGVPGNRPDEQKVSTDRLKREVVEAMNLAGMQQEAYCCRLDRNDVLTPIG